MFQSTRPMRGATYIFPLFRLCRTRFNPRAPCGARLCLYIPIRRACDVSIHAPHAGRDSRILTSVSDLVVSIHAPHAGRDRFLMPVAAISDGFNPRAPCGARLLFLYRLQYHYCFNPRAPCGARLCEYESRLYPCAVSIHAPHAGRDRAIFVILPSRLVSIHAPHAGRDQT